MKNNYLALVGVVAALSLSSAATGQATLTNPLTKQTATKSVWKNPAAAALHVEVPARDASRGSAPANDECDFATVLTVGSECTPLSTNALDATQSLDPILCNGFTSPEGNDVWFSFEATGTVTSITVEGVGTFDAVMEGFTGTCGALTSVACADATFPPNSTLETLTLATTAGETYYVRVYSYWAPVPTDFDFTICAFTPSNVPENDVCTGTTPVDLAIDGSVTFTGDNTGALDTEGLGFASVWHAFTITECANVVLDYCGTTPAFENASLGLFIGCPDTDVVGSSSFDLDICGDGNVTIFYDGLAAGTYYYAVLTEPGAQGPYTINVAATACPAAPANDLCTDITAVDLAIDGSVTFTGDNTGALDTEGLGFDNVWHAFTITECANVVLDYCGTTPAFENASLSLFIGCPNTSFVGTNSFDLETCTDGNVTIFFPGLAAGTYYYAVLTEPGAQGPYTINVAATACPPGPANDECAGAQSLNVNLTCVPTPGTTADATQSLAPILCNGFTSNNALDVWYSFVATTPEHTITVEGIEEFDGVLEFFSGDCAGLTSVSCTDDNFPNPDPVTEVMVQTGLTVGATYYVRVYDYAHASVNHLFNICVTGDVGTAVDGIAGNINSFSVFPNPGNGDMTIVSGDVSGAVVIQLMDMTGRIMHAEQRAMVAGQAQQLELAGRLATGSYVLRLSTEQGTSEQRVVIR
jgi:hypothetical protein